MDLNNKKDFSEYVYICTLDELNIKLMQDYLEPTPKNEGYYIKSKPLDKLYFDNLNNDDFTSSTVGKGKQNIINTSIRSSKIYKKTNVHIKTNDSLIYGYDRDNVETINSQKIKPLSKSLRCEYLNKLHLLKYEVDDHFNEFHYDTFKDNIIATLLIFPPTCMYGNFSGGDLVFMLDDTELRVETSTFTDKFMCVIFNSIKHKCEPITGGIRYVFKSAIKSKLPNVLSTINTFKITDSEKFNEESGKEFIQKTLENNKMQLEQFQIDLKNIVKKYHEIQIIKFTEDIDNNSIPEKLRPDETEINDELKDLEANYRRLANKIRSLQNSIIYIESGLNSSNKSIELYMTRYKLKEDKYNLCVLPYYIEDMNNLNLYYSTTIGYIKYLLQNGWNVTRMYDTFSFKTDCEEGTRNLIYTKIFNNSYQDYDDSYNNCGKYKLIYKDIDIMNGKCIDYHTEYNDSSGDDIYEDYECSCLLIWK